MTPGAINSADRDQLFSQALRQHAHSLDLTDLMPVGKWTFGQGVRRAHGNRFFWDLSSTAFNPFGLHHPVVLRLTEDESSISAREFGRDIVSLIPGLATWRWTLISAENPILRTQDTSFFLENSLLKSPLGWSGLEKVNQLKNWAVKISESTYFYASNCELPAEIVRDATAIAWLKLFFTSDILGPEGRLAQVREQLHSKFSSAKIIGTQILLSHSSPGSLQERGLNLDILTSDQIRLCFPLSYLNSDLEGVKALLAQ
ncbi:MAG: hypothetical protein ACK5XN_04800 [Bacteroidota bacterium]